MKNNLEGLLNVLKKGAAVSSNFHTTFSMINTS